MLSKKAQKRVQGHLPKKRDIVDWSEAKRDAVLRFTDFFTDKKSGSYVWTKDKVAAAWVRATDEQFWDEFLTRIDVENQNHVKARYRFMTLVRVVLNWLKENPHAISKDMWTLMNDNPRMQWAIKHFELKETDMGAEVVSMNRREETDPRVANVTPDSSRLKTPQVLYNEALYDMASVFSDLLRGINKSEIKKMTTQQRLDMANKMAATLAKSFAQYKPNRNTFTQININKGSREDLEKANLEYVEGQQ